jgi:hypothetical protein
MNEYYNYSNFESDNLDKLAREINNKKTSMVKKVSEDYDNQQKLWKKNIDNVLNNQKFSFLHMNKNNPTNHDNYYTLNNQDDSNNFDNKSLYSFSTYQSSNNTNNTNNTNNLNSNDSIFSDSFLIDSESIDSKSIDMYLDNVANKKGDKKSDKLFSNIIHSINYDECSRNDDNIFDHIKKCNNCKNKLIKYLNLGISSNNINNNTTNDIFDIKFSKSQKMTIKEIIIIVILGIFIIIILDMLIRKK